MKKFYLCKICGNLVELLEEGKGELVCCGQPMTLLKPNTIDAVLEKHVPVVAINKNIVTVKVGSIAHPMTEEHYIKWIYLKAGNITQRIELKPGDKPEATFIVDSVEGIEALAYCNLHGLWKNN